MYPSNRPIGLFCHRGDLERPKAAVQVSVQNCVNLRWSTGDVCWAGLEKFGSEDLEFVSKFRFQGGFGGRRRSSFENDEEKTSFWQRSFRPLLIWRKTVCLKL